MAYEGEIRAIVTGLTRVTEKVITRLSFNVTANLIEDTPVDTGWARANWVPSIGVSYDSPAVAPSDPGQVSGQAAAQQAAVAGLTGYKLRRGRVFISNNVPYIRRLNDGSSKQAPRGFVQAAIRRGIAQTGREVK